MFLFQARPILPREEGEGGMWGGVWMSPIHPLPLHSSMSLTLLKIAQGFGTVSQNHDTSTSLQLAIHDHIEKALVLHKAYFGWKSLWNVVIPQTFFAVHVLTFRMKQEWDSSLTLNLHFWMRIMFMDTANSAHDRFSTCVKCLQN